MGEMKMERRQRIARARGRESQDTGPVRAMTTTGLVFFAICSKTVHIGCYVNEKSMFVCVFSTNILSLSLSLSLSLYIHISLSFPLLPSLSPRQSLSLTLKFYSTLKTRNINSRNLFCNIINIQNANFGSCKVDGARTAQENLVVYQSPFNLNHSFYFFLCLCYRVLIKYIFFKYFKIFRTLAFLCFPLVSVCVHIPGR